MTARLIDVLEPERMQAAKATCTHVFRSGRRCNREPVDNDDSMLCVLHGGDLESASESVRRRLIDLQATCIGAMEELIVFGDDRTRVQVAVAVLDRTGLGPKSVLSVRREDEGDDIAGMSDEQIEQELAQLHAKAAAETRRRRDAALMEGVDVSGSKPN